MNSGSQRLRTDAEQQQVQNAQQQQKTGAAEFATPEEMIRSDAAQTVVPERIRDRVAATVAADPPPAKPWWRRMFD